MGDRAVRIAKSMPGVLALLSLCTAPVQANICAMVGSSGTASLSGVLNTYFPATASAASGATSIVVGSSSGAVSGIASGDLLLVIQMQDTAITTTNSSRYGDNVLGAPGAGYTAIQQAGLYEYVRATNSIPASGGTVTIAGATGGGLINSYTYTAANGSTLKRSFQVIRVPQYRDATISGTVTAAPWDGTRGGVVAIDVAGRITFSGSISVAGQGFRGGGGRSQSGAASGVSDTDYASLASLTANAAKGEGIAGTPRYVFNAASGTVTDTGVEGYPGGSNARGAPANAGGGGTDGNPAANDENTGGGGGGNGGDGGQGGYAWCAAPTGPNGCNQSGGNPGANVAELSVTRVVMGGGGGAATTNNATGTPANGVASSGAPGGGIVMVRAGEIAGIGSIDADGADANNTVLNDGTGGGGAGGSVILSSLRSVAGASVSVSANGGNGGTNTGGGTPHGPGGGGGGGFVARTSTVSVSASVSGGSAGTTNAASNFGANYGATAGGSGLTTTVTSSSIPGVSSGAECTPTITKAFATSPISPGATSQMSITVVNNNPTTAMSALAFNDSYPAGLVNTATPSAVRSCGNGTLTAAANGSSLALAAGTITAAGNCTYSVNTTVTSSGDKTNTIAVGGITWNYGSYSLSSPTAVSATVSVTPPLTIVKSSQAYADPVNGTTNPKLIPGSYVAYTLTIANPSSLTVDNNSVVVLDATPANLQLYVADVPGGTGPVLFTNGTPTSGLTYTFGGLASTTDDVEFSNNGGSTWTYTPTANALSVDPNVTHIRIKPKGSMAPNSSFTLVFGYMVR